VGRLDGNFAPEHAAINRGVQAVMMLGDLVRGLIPQVSACLLNRPRC
jgi:hypothetical protein